MSLAQLAPDLGIDAAFAADNEARRIKPKTKAFALIFVMVRPLEPCEKALIWP